MTTEQTTTKQTTTTQEAYPFLVKVAHHEYVQAPRVRATWREKRRAKRTRAIAGVQFTEVEHAGWDHGGLTVFGFGVGQLGEDGRLPLLRAIGRSFGSGRAGQTVDATAAGVKSVVRRIRPQEAEAIAAVDADIAEHEKAIAGLREERKQLVALAWTNGHVVRLAEIKPDGDGARKLDR